MGWQETTKAEDEEPDESIRKEAQDWGDINFFGEKAIAPQKRRRAPSAIPDTRLLFQVQEDILKAIGAFKRLPVELDKEDSDYMKAHKALKTQLENGYKLMNRYLRTYVNQEPT